VTYGELRAAFARDQVDASVLCAKAQIELALAFTELYERRGLIRAGAAPPLWECCPHASECWPHALDARSADGPEDGGVSLPWIGPEYERGGVVVVGINFNDANGLTRAFELGAAEAEEFSAGRSRVTYSSPGYTGSDFPYGSTRTAAAVMDHLAGAPARDREHPEDWVDALNRLLRMQAIQCSPRNTAASQPTDAMWNNCPPLLLADGLRIAAPAAVVAFGKWMPWVFEQLDAFTLEGNRQRLAYGTLALDEPVPAFMLDHPRYQQGWPVGQASLLALLGERARR
jgi:hypothetical protein